MNKLRCIIVEDEIPAAKELEYLVSLNKQVMVEAIANDGRQGLKFIKELSPDAVFLDINMPIKDGVALAKEIKSLYNKTDIVFVTAYEQHAVEAFKLEAVDYILKPFDEKRINITVERLIEKWLVRNKKNDEIPNMISEIINKLGTKDRCCKRIPCEHGGKTILIDVKDIYFVYIEDEKTLVKTKDQCFLTSYTLNQIEKKTQFFRAHRSYLVNMDNTKEFYSWFNGTYKLVMNDNDKSEIPISRGNVKKFKDMLEI